MTLTICQVVYSTDFGVAIAKADDFSTAFANAFFIDENVLAGDNGNIRTHGILNATQSQWAAVTGEPGGLTSGARYYLSETTAGHMTKVPPTSGFVVFLGTAADHNSFIVRISPPIQL